MSKLLGERLTKAMQQRHICARQLAWQAGVTEASLSRYLSGAREPVAGVLTRLALALDVSADYLLGIEGRSMSSVELIELTSRKSKSMNDQEKLQMLSALVGDAARTKNRCLRMYMMLQFPLPENTGMYAGT